MALEADRNQVAVVVGAAVSFWFDVVNRSCRNWPTIAQALLADVSITFKDSGADDVPLTAVATLVAAKAALMLLPSFITVGFAVAGTVSSGACAAALTTGPRDCGRH